MSTCAKVTNYEKGYEDRAFTGAGSGNPFLDALSTNNNDNANICEG